MNFEAEPALLVLYDGVCGLCNRAVQFIIRTDKQRKFRYATLQGNTAKEYRKRHAEIPEEIDTVVLVENGRVYLRSRAALRIAWLLGFPWSLLYAFRIVPAAIADVFYNFIARIRYRVFGKYDICKIPAPEERALFLE